jgi:hypothetical protein
MLEAGRQRRIAQVSALLERLEENEHKVVAEAVAILENVLQA